MLLSFGKVDVSDRQIQRQSVKFWSYYLSPDVINGLSELLQFIQNYDFILLMYILLTYNHIRTDKDH